MMLRSSALFLYITYVTSSSSNGCTSTSGADTDKLKDKQPYIFPETKTDNAIDTATNLLNSQGTYQKEVERCFRAICKKNQNHTKIELLERTIDGTIEMAGELVHNSTEIIQETIKNGSVSDYFKKKPITFKTSRLLVDCWNYVDDFAKNYVKQNDFDANPEADVMLKCADLAIREIKAYQKYLEIVYEETGIYRDDETNFSYLKFKKKEEEWKNRDRSD